jgi:hypothetical protein
VSASQQKPEAGFEPWERGSLPDEGSFPPVAEFGLRGGDPEDLMDDGDPRDLERHRALMSPGAKMRRAKFAKYVGIAMAASVALCAAAVVKVALFSGADSMPPRVVALGGPAHESPAPMASAAPGPSALQAQRPEVPSAGPTSAAPAAVPPTAASASSVAIEPAPSASAAEPAPKAVVAPAAGATKERESSRFALERGDLGAAVSAGERSVALDPTDGEAWLVLGAAYQARGDVGEAKRCYRACVERGTRGPKSECRAMAQGP